MTQLLFAFQTCINPFIYAKSIPAFSKAVQKLVFNRVISGKTSRQGQSCAKDSGYKGSEKKGGNSIVSQDDVDNNELNINDC